MTPILLLGEARGEAEARANSSFIGPSGIELIRMLTEAGAISLTAVDRDHISRYYIRQEPHHLEAIWRAHPNLHRTNVFNLHPPGNDLEHFCGPKQTAIPGYPPLLKSKYVREEFSNELNRLAEEIQTHNPNVIVCLGNTALWAMGGRTGISKLRGTTLISTHTVSGYKLLPTYHPAAILRAWENRPVTIADLTKATRESLSPDLNRPVRSIWIEPTLPDIIRFIDAHIIGCRLLSVDIETVGSRVTCIGFAPSPSLAIVIPFDDARRSNGSYWPTPANEAECWRLIRRVLVDPSIHKLFQNGAYDIAFLFRSIGIGVRGATEDTMLLHHALQPESLKGLGFLGSVYSDEGSWKGMKKHETIKRDD